MRVFVRYLAREVYGGAAMVLLAFLALFSFFDLIAELGNLGKGDYHIQHALAYVALMLPGRIYEIFPIAALIGTLYALSTLARHSELTVLRASGLSTVQLLGVLLRLGLLFSLLTFLCGEFLAPPAERMGLQVRMKAMNSVMAQEFRSGLWMKDERRFINVRTILPGNLLEGIRIYEFDENYHLKAVSEAERGEFSGNEHWRLSGVVRTSFDGTSTRVERQPVVEWSSALTPDILGVLLVVPERMTIQQLWTYVRHLSENQQKTQRYEIALWKKAVYPLAALVMMALALPFGYTHDRMGGVAVKIFSGVMLGIFFHMLNGLFSSLGVINSWPPLMSAVTPSALFLLTALLMLWWVERR